MDDIDPSKAWYDESKTIDYRTRQPGTARSLQNKDALRPGLSSGVFWEFDGFRHGRHVEDREFGYDSNGYLCNVGHGQGDATRREIREHIFKKGESEIADPPWAEQRFGKELNIGLQGGHDDVISDLVISQLGSRADETRMAPGSIRRNTSPDHFSPGQRPVRRFLAQFEAKWDLNRDLWGSSDDKGSADIGWGGGSTHLALTNSHKEDVLFQYHMRVFTTQSGGLRRAYTGRVSGHLTAPSDVRRDLDIHEIRYSVGLKTTWKFDLPVFTLVTMSNSFSGLEDLGELYDASAWRAVNIRPLIRATGIAAFAFRVRSLLPGWADQWSRLLDQIDRVLSADLATMLQPESLRKTMVDDEQLLEFYPLVLQILRIAADWIQESIDDLQWLVDDMERLYFSPNTSGDSYATFLPLNLKAVKAEDAAISVFKKNWESVKSKQQRLAKTLLTRIARKQAEVESLKDAIFMITSVREAKKSTQLNHYIFVFTVVTIFYLPLSFIATLFALDHFRWDDPRQIVSFNTTITLVATATYAFSGFLIWFTRRPRKLSAHLLAAVEWFRYKFSSG